MSDQNIVARSATTTPSPQARSHAIPVAKLIDVSKCIGCKACQTACSEWNDLEYTVGTNDGTYNNPNDLEANAWTVMRFFETDAQSGPLAGTGLDWTIRKDGCMHCEDPGCLKACPSPGAIIKYANGIVDFNSDNCIGCGYCVTGCPFNVPRISEKDKKAYKCTLCSDRVNVGLEPACVKTCPTGAIMFGSKADMQDQAHERILDLKERGYTNAGLYDPAGVGGTHVMYVLKDAQNPQAVHLPVDPTISPMVSLWKGITKPLASLALGAVALGGFLHYITVGPKEEPVDDHDMDPRGPEGEDDPDAIREVRRDRHEKQETRRDL